MVFNMATFISPLQILGDRCHSLAVSPGSDLGFWPHVCE